MINEKKIDQFAKKSASEYQKVIKNIVSKSLKAKKNMTNKEFGKMMLNLDMKSIVSEEMKNIQSEYVAEHIKILKDKKPIGK